MGLMFLVSTLGASVLVVPVSEVTRPWTDGGRNELGRKCHMLGLGPV